MDTLQFIRHHTRKILSEEGPKYSTRKGLGAGRISAKARQSLGLAATNPTELLRRLKVDNYKTKGNTKLDEVLNFLIEVFTKSELGIAFERPQKADKGISIPITMIAGKTPAVPKSQAPRYVQATLLAATSNGLIDFDFVRDDIQLGGTGKEQKGSEKFAVIITYKG